MTAISVTSLVHQKEKPLNLRKLGANARVTEIQEQEEG